MSSQRIAPDDLSAALGEALTVYQKSVTDQLNNLSEKAVTKLVQRTKATAPVGDRGRFRKKISGTLKVKRINGNVYAWYVQAPDHRLTHLLVHGHATKNGGRTKANPFLQNALAEVLPEYEREVEEMLQNDN